MKPVKFSVQVPKDTPGAFDNTQEIEIGNNPHAAGQNFILGDDQGGSIKPAGLIPLDAADNQDRVSGPFAIQFMDTEIRNFQGVSMAGGCQHQNDQACP